MSYLELRAGNFFTNHLAYPSHHPINRSEFRPPPTNSFVNHTFQQHSYWLEQPPMMMIKNPTMQHQHQQEVGHHPMNHLVHGMPPGLPCPTVVDSRFRFPMPPGLYNVQPSSPPVDYLPWQSNVYHHHHHQQQQQQQQPMMNYQPIHSNNYVERTNFNPSFVNRVNQEEHQIEHLWCPYDRASQSQMMDFMQPTASEIRSARTFEESNETYEMTEEVDPIQQARLIALTENDEDQNERVEYEEEDDDDYVDVAESYEEDDFEELESSQEYETENYDDDDCDEDRREIVVENDVFSDFEEYYDVESDCDDDDEKEEGQQNESFDGFQIVP